MCASRDPAYLKSDQPIQTISMKSRAFATVAVLTLAAPIASFAQQADHPLTRAEVKAELIRLEAAGYRPASDHTQYPANIQAAERKVNQLQSAQDAANPTPNLANTSFGGVATTATSSGKTNAPAGHDSIYRAH